MTAGTAFPTGRLDRRWRYTAINDAFAAMVGLRRDEVIGRTCWELFPGFAETAMAEAMRVAMRTGRAQSGRFPAQAPLQGSVVLTVAPVAAGVEVVWSHHPEALAADGVASSSRFG